MEEDHHTPDYEDHYHGDQPEAHVEVQASDISDAAANYDQNQQQQQQQPPQYQPQPPPQGGQQQPQFFQQQQQPQLRQPPVQFPPQQPPQGPPRPIQYLAPQQPRPPPQQFPPQSPPQFQAQQPPYKPPQQFPPQNGTPNQQNHPFGQPPPPAKYPPQPPSPVKYPPQSPAQYPPPAGGSSQPPQGYNGIPQPAKQNQTPPPVQVGYNKPQQPPQQYYQQQQYQPQQNHYAAPPAPAQGVPMQGPYGPQGTPMTMNMMNPIGTEGWKTGLFDCMDDPNNALITLFVPCLTFGQIAEVVDNGTTSCGTSALLYGLVGAFIGVPFIMSCTYRTKIRSKYGLVETPAPDWVTHLFCEPCSLCQEYRELNMRGLDPSIGWQGNVARAMQQQQPNMMTPPMNQMMR
ncbi:PREDICTED: protein PLANT CADMIUM RESISTANCE 6-like [Fragaria vesca subsp. vesca]|uniref:protein PLANT CADMIUM RESISTANCE 6-like n=1 Tax=Fragaria vesca subsp. vesca TaxID=101020 RepID=UPI0002C2F671|nr:PREDICTED: protein PLANT CADMIUM RESISTANCE 6-like [Fragaria vesca subsp. vesca]